MNEEEVKDRMRLLEQLRATEVARNDLMGVNEELRNKIRSLEQGQEDLIARLNEYDKKFEDSQ